MRYRFEIKPRDYRYYRRYRPAKTTLVQLIPRLYVMGGRKILVGRHDVRDYKLDTLRDAIAICFRKMSFFPEP